MIGGFARLDHYLLASFARLCDSEHLAVDTTEGLAQGERLDEASPSRIPLNLRNVVLQVRVRVRIAVGEKDSVVVVAKFVRERQRVVILRVLVILAHLVLEVADIGAGSVPPDGLVICLSLGVHGHFHPVVEH